MTELSKTLQNSSDGELKLKPCPFCGGKAVMNEYSGREYTCYYIECPHCHISTQVKYSETMTIKTWNRRAEPSEADLLAIINGWLDSERFTCDLSQDE